jgi:hypothetical protein
LTKAKEDIKWGDNNPKEMAWTACVAALVGSETLSGEVAKDSKAVKRRWQRVRPYRITCILYIHVYYSSQAETRISDIQTYAQSNWMGMEQ